MRGIIEKYSIHLFLLFFFILGCISIYIFDGTGERGSGDSILHYLYAKYSFEKPELLLNHWAKPLFTLLAAPFAQFGFAGIKLFNLIVHTLTILYTYKTAKSLKLSTPIFTSAVLFSIPLFLVLTFSGLTEPLFALFIAISSYLFIEKKYVAGCIILSFMPFVRSEGLIIIGVFSFFLMLKNKWKLLPLLALGHVVYSIIGSFYYDDILWVFTKIPYAKMSSTYGDGKLIHFAHQLFYVVGFPIYVTLVGSSLIFIYRAIKVKKFIWSEISVLIFGSFIAFFTAHTLFWYLGIFNSMGLKRVMICVAPQMAIISLIVYNTITNETIIKNKSIRTTLKTILIVGILIFPYSGHKAAIDFNEDLFLTEPQQTAQLAEKPIKELRNENTFFLYSDPYLSEVLEINHFDKSKKEELWIENIDSLKTNDIIIWDSWFSVVENGVSREQIESRIDLKKISALEKEKRSYLVYLKK